MNFFKTTITSIFFLILSVNTFAQKDSFKFDEDKHSFGTIEENGGSATHKFEFTNTGTEPIKIAKVKASCGCTTPSWSKEEIKPGEKGHVTAKYNPKNRPGKFNKTLTVTTGKNEQIFLRINGNVTKAELPPENKYPYLSGGLRYKSEVINLGTVMHNEDKEVKIPIYNVSENEINLLENVTKPSHIEVTLEKGVIAGKKYENVTFSFMPEKIDDWGTRVDEVKFSINGKESIVKIATTIRENFSKLTDEEKANAPKISLSKSKLNFGTVATGKKAKSTIVFTNNGKSDLIIRKVNSTCGCTVVKTKKNVLKPGKSGKLIVTLDTSEKDYNQNNMITLICNDPEVPEHNIQIRANIDE